MWSQRDGTLGKTLALLEINQVRSPAPHYGPPSGMISENRARSKPWSLLGVAPKQKIKGYYLSSIIQEKNCFLLVWFESDLTVRGWGEWGMHTYGLYSYHIGSSKTCQ